MYFNSENILSTVICQALRDSVGTSKHVHVPFNQGRKTGFKQIIRDVMDIKRRMLRKFRAKEFNLGQKQVKIA